MFGIERSIIVKKTFQPPLSGADWLVRPATKGALADLFGQSVEILQAPRHAGLPGDLIEVVRQSPDHMYEPKVGKNCSKA
jgi:hypothetical protein